MTFKAISQLVQKDPTTISYEIKHHRQEHRNSFTYDHEPCPLLPKGSLRLQRLLQTPLLLLPLPTLPLPRLPGPFRIQDTPLGCQGGHPS
ncbi:MAG: helix-turn-helix domain-containing protein [Clostridia bacterium]